MTDVIIIAKNNACCRNLKIDWLSTIRNVEHGSIAAIHREAVLGHVADNVESKKKLLPGATHIVVDEGNGIKLPCLCRGSCEGCYVCCILEVDFGMYQHADVHHEDKKHNKRHKHDAYHDGDLTLSFFI